jgi:hypothetical protein
MLNLNQTCSNLLEKVKTADLQDNEILEPIYNEMWKILTDCPIDTLRNELGKDLFEDFHNSTYYLEAIIAINDYVTNTKED